MLFFQDGGKIYHSFCGRCLDGGFRELGVEAIEMIGTEILQLDMPDLGIDARCLLFVPDDGAVLRPARFFQLNYIIAVIGELPAAVAGRSFSAFLLKGRGESLGLFSCAFFLPF